MIRLSCIKNRLLLRINRSDDKQNMIFVTQKNTISPFIYSTKKLHIYNIQKLNKLKKNKQIKKSTLLQQSGRAKRHMHSCVFLLRPPLPKARRRGGRQFFEL